MKIEELHNSKVGICASGGLVSLFIAQLLKEADVEYRQFVVDIGQSRQEMPDLTSEKVSLMNDFVLVDLKDAIATECLEAVRAQAQYDGGYWNTTGIARGVTVRGLVDALRKSGCNVMAHGAVHGGNDELRFNYYLKMFAPEIQPFSPWQDPETAKRFRDRVEMGRFVADPESLDVLAAKAKHSVDGNLGGVSHENVLLENVTNSAGEMVPTMGVRIVDAPAVGEVCEITFKAGFPVAINGKPTSHCESILEANKIAGRNGVVFKNVVENRMNGTKGRGFYESPGLDLLGTALRHLYGVTLDRDSWEILRFLSPFVARQTYAGRLFDPATRSALDAAKSIAQTANGTVSLTVQKGLISIDRVFDFTKTRFTAQQFRFAHGGQKWITEEVV